MTLDPGVDLGQAEASIIGLYAPLTTAEQFAAMQAVIGVRRQAAKDALDANPTLQSIRIGSDQAEGLMAFTAKPYWSGIGGRFNTLRQSDTIGSVQTALLSLAYNRGAPNPALAPLEDRSRPADGRTSPTSSTRCNRNSQPPVSRPDDEKKRSSSDPNRRFSTSSTARFDVAPGCGHGSSTPRRARWARNSAW